MADSVNEASAIVCCDHDHLMDDHLCHSKYHVSHRLSKLPDAMLLPLVPVLWRLVTRAMGHRDSDSYAQIMSRLVLYIGICYVRFYIFYKLLNAWEDSHMRIAVTDEATSCWYGAYLRKPSCFGRAFDFSDHIVLYYGQISLIVVTEISHSIMIQSSSSPWWWIVIAPFVLWLHYLIYHGTYMTAAYFHTNSEVYAGFIVSLCLALPLCFWQSKRWFPFRR